MSLVHTVAPGITSRLQPGLQGTAWPPSPRQTRRPPRSAPPRPLLMPTAATAQATGHQRLRHFLVSLLQSTWERGQTPCQGSKARPTFCTWLQALADHGMQPSPALPHPLASGTCWKATRRSSGQVRVRSAVPSARSPRPFLPLAQLPAPLSRGGGRFLPSQQPGPPSEAERRALPRPRCLSLDCKAWLGQKTDVHHHV